MQQSGLMRLIMALVGILSGCISAHGEANLLQNGHFAADASQGPAQWTVRDSGQKVSLDSQEKPTGAEQSLRLEVMNDAGENYGEILQVVKIKPATQYRLQGKIKVTQPRLGIYQVKLYKGGKEIRRISTDETMPGQWHALTTEFASEDADSAQALCRWRQNRLTIGQTVWFADVKLTELGPAPVAKREPVPPLAPKCEAIPTFQSLGLYWSLPEGSATVAAKVAYRAAGDTAWKGAQDLWFDGRALGGRPAEYRGSIVALKPGTRYEVRLALAGTTMVQTLDVTTWSERFPIARTVALPASSTTTLEINDVHGAPDGYILFAGPGGGPASIDVANRAPCNVRVKNSSYIIIRGLKLIGAGQHGIILGDGRDDDVHDVIIENNDISGWGTNDETGFGIDHHSGVYANCTKLQRVVIQRNRIHNPRSNANSWKQNRKGGTAEDHPLGPQAISFMNGKGQYVVRYNELFGDPEHHFNDSMGADRNFSYDGYPNRDSDIYGNYIAYCWDDGLEIEGACMNVRVWGNYITETYHPIATASVSMGPLYIFRNVASISRTGPKHSYGQCFLKAGGTRTRNGYFGDGRVYVFNNTTLVLPGSESQVRGGIGDGDRTLSNYVTRNNIFHVPTATNGWPESLFSISDRRQSGTNSFDYDLYNGQVRAVAGSESHGIIGVPVYIQGVGFNPKAMTGNFSLAPNSPGHDAGVVLANFTDGYTGTAPDIGAHESGTPPMRFGVTASRE